MADKITSPAIEPEPEKNPVSPQQLERRRDLTLDIPSRQSTPSEASSSSSSSIISNPSEETDKEKEKRLRDLKEFRKAFKPSFTTEELELQQSKLQESSEVIDAAYSLMSVAHKSENLDQQLEELKQCKTKSAEEEKRERLHLMTGRLRDFLNDTGLDEVDSVSPPTSSPKTAAVIAEAVDAAAAAEAAITSADVIQVPVSAAAEANVVSPTTIDASVIAVTLATGPTTPTPTPVVTAPPNSVEEVPSSTSFVVAAEAIQNEAASNVTQHQNFHIDPALNVNPMDYFAQAGRNYFQAYDNVVEVQPEADLRTPIPPKLDPSMMSQTTERRLRDRKRKNHENRSAELQEAKRREHSFQHMEDSIKWCNLRCIKDTEVFLRSVVGPFAQDILTKTNRSLAGRIADLPATVFYLPREPLDDEFLYRRDPEIFISVTNIPNEPYEHGKARGAVAALFRKQPSEIYASKPWISRDKIPHPRDGNVVTACQIRFSFPLHIDWYTKMTEMPGYNAIRSVAEWQSFARILECFEMTKKIGAATGIFRNEHVIVDWRKFRHREMNSVYLEIPWNLPEDKRELTPVARYSARTGVIYYPLHQ